MNTMSISPFIASTSFQNNDANNNTKNGSHGHNFIDIFLVCIIIYLWIKIRILKAK